MILHPEVQLHIECPVCHEGNWRVDHLERGSSGYHWSCDECHNCFDIHRQTGLDFDVVQIPGPKGKEMPVTVTLVSMTFPQIILKLNTWKYGHSQNDTPEEYLEHQRYFYNEHTCPTNWTDQIVSIEFEGDADPHGVFKLLSIEDGHWVDPSGIK
jgi:hypothetical protein